MWLRFHVSERVTWRAAQLELPQIANRLFVTFVRSSHLKSGKTSTSSYEQNTVPQPLQRPSKVAFTKTIDKRKVFLHSGSPPLVVSVRLKVFPLVFKSKLI